MRFRAVTLVTTPPTYVDDAWVRLTRDRRIAVDAVLDGKGAAGGALTLAIPALGLTLDGKADAAGTWSVSVPVPAALARWSPATPRLSDVPITARTAIWKTRIGSRTLEAPAAPIPRHSK